LILAVVTTSTFAALGFVQATAEGFRNPPSGTFGLGRAGGRIAHVDDSSAVTHNPANLLDLARPEFELVPTIADLEWEFRSADGSGQAADTEDTWKILPNFFAALPLKDRPVAFGLGITTPYGMASQWDTSSSAFARPTGLLRYQSPFSAQLMTINANPSVALALGDHLQIGAGFDAMWSQLTLKQFYPWFLGTGNLLDADGVAKAKGDGIGYGGNVGLTLKLAKRHRLAFTYRSPLRVTYDGDFELSHVPAALGGGTMKRDFESEVQFPTILAAGYGIQLSESVRLEADIEWLEFSNFDRLPLRVPSPPPGLPSAAPENWKNTFTVGVGGDWRFASNWVLRASYQYYQSPIPNSTLSPTLVDANQNVVTVGLGYQHNHHRLGLAYSPVFYDTRRVRSSYNPAYNGEYKVTLHLIAVSYGFLF
jgi:long-chain fatty acid transport protein